MARSPEEKSNRGQQGSGVLAVRLHDDGLKVEEIETPSPDPGEVLVRVHAAAITRDELEWPVDRLPAIPSYELSGVIAVLGPNGSDLAVGDAVWALTGFGRDGAAADYTLVPVPFLAPKPRTLGHLESAAIPLAGLTAWQGLFEHGRLREGERVLIHGAAGGVGQFATQLARWRGTHVIGMASGRAAVEDVLAFGANEAIDRTAVPFEEAVAPVDLVFDTVGGQTLARSVSVLREGGRLVSVAEEPPTTVRQTAEATYFVVEPSRDQLIQLARLVTHQSCWLSQAIAPFLTAAFQGSGPCGGLGAHSRGRRAITGGSPPASSHPATLAISGSPARMTMRLMTGTRPSGLRSLRCQARRAAYAPAVPRIAPSRASAPAVAPVRVRRVVLLAPAAARVRRSFAVSLRISPTVIPSTPSARRMPAAVDQSRSRPSDACTFRVST